MSLTELTVAEVTSSQYTVDLSSVTGAAGAYVLTLRAVRANIQDMAGNPLTVEALDAFTANPWHNYANPHDVDDNALVEPLDVLILIIYINTHPGDASLPVAPESPRRYYDVKLTLLRLGQRSTSVTFLLVVQRGLWRRLTWTSGSAGASPSQPPVPLRAQDSIRRPRTCSSTPIGRVRHLLGQFCARQTIQADPRLGGL